MGVSVSVSIVSSHFERNFEAIKPRFEDINTVELRVNIWRTFSASSAEGFLAD